MQKNASLYLVILILIAIVIIAISIVASNYNKDRSIVPDVSLGVLSSENMIKVQEKYDTEENKEKFILLAKDIELKVANIILDGTVTNDAELQDKIQYINGILKTKNWTALGIEYPTYWMGIWSLDSKGNLLFTFEDESIKPSWAKDTQCSKYIK